MVDFFFLRYSIGHVGSDRDPSAEARSSMRLDTGTAVVIAAVLVFYLRLIILQRQRAKQLRLAQAQPAGGKKKKRAAQEAQPSRHYSIVSPRTSDRVVAGVGVLAILAGVLLNLGVIPLPGLQALWWLPMAVGIVAFSWLFRL